MPEMTQEFLNALSQDMCAMQRFAALDEQEKDIIIKKAESARSAQEIQHIIKRL